MLFARPDSAPPEVWISRGAVELIWRSLARHARALINVSAGVAVPSAERSTAGHQ